MSEKKEGKGKVVAKAAAAPVKKSKVDPATKVKRGPNGKKEMKVARGTERAARRADLRKGWRTVANAKQMAPSKTELLAAAA